MHNEQKYYRKHFNQYGINEFIDKALRLNAKYSATKYFRILPMTKSQDIKKNSI